MKRRSFLNRILILVAWLLPVGIYNHCGDARQTDEDPNLGASNLETANSRLASVSALYLSRENIERIAEIYLKNISIQKKNSIKSSVESLGPFKEESFLVFLKEKISQDFASGNVVRVDDWTLSEAECQVCAYITG